jgi:phosphoserine phosphatase
MKYRSVVLDVDSTLCGVEGIDWLASRRGPDVARQIASLTDRAMNGEMPLEAVYGERLRLIAPSRQEVESLAQEYRRTIAPGARGAIAAMRAAGVRVVLVSGGLRPAIRPLADELGVELHAVDIAFTPDGMYAGFDNSSPLTWQDGKEVVVASLRLDRPALAVGDGSTDLHMKSGVDRFLAFTGFVSRTKVVAQAAAGISSYDALRHEVLDADDS